MTKDHLSVDKINSEWPFCFITSSKISHGEK